MAAKYPSWSLVTYEIRFGYEYAIFYDIGMQMLADMGDPNELPFSHKKNKSGTIHALTKQGLINEIAKCKRLNYNYDYLERALKKWPIRVVRGAIDEQARNEAERTRTLLWRMKQHSHNL